MGKEGRGVESNHDLLHASPMLYRFGYRVWSKGVLGEETVSAVGAIQRIEATLSLRACILTTLVLHLHATALHLFVEAILTK